MKVLHYSDWADTAWTLHMIMQMTGKVKLEKMCPQPEWAHARLYPTAQGFATGLIPNGEQSFNIYISLKASMVHARCQSGELAGFPLRDNTSVSEHYDDFLAMLDNIGCPISLNPIPQECADDTPFDRQKEKLRYDYKSAAHFHENCVFANHALFAATAFFRGKKLIPALFFGTFDFSTALFSGEESPLSGGDLISRVAFDEKFVELGFWPGDPDWDEPAFYALPYPFRKDDPLHGGITPKEAFFSPEKMEYFLRLSDALRYPDPVEIVRKFYQDVFYAAAKAEGWKNMDWFTKPLLV